MHLIPQHWFISLADAISHVKFHFQVTKCTFHFYGPSGTISNIDAICVVAQNNLNDKVIKFFYFLIKNGPIPASFCLFSFFSRYNFNTNWKSIDGVLGIQTRGRRMVGADETTELWQPRWSKVTPFSVLTICKCYNFTTVCYAWSMFTNLVRMTIVLSFNLSQN